MSSLKPPILNQDELEFIASMNGEDTVGPLSSSASQLDRWALIVEDDPLVRSELASAISRQGILCWHACQLGEVRRRMDDETPPSIVFLDLRLPDGNGMELLKDSRFQRWKKFHGVQVVVITGHGTAALAEEAEGQGALAFLNKPVSLRQLKAITLEGLNRREVELGQDGHL
ncbi:MULTISPECIES: response regulator [Ectothiorhodospira]|uniref:response regulator n=1 Tax=Ectothiorhodospira TaxID=1051 RepID=UPI001EE9940F|nr:MULTISPECIES: response regulator [Ectothiorhodospira]MCG5495873.1 response regulator [Ectothiorhodospira variabilis]MCG5498524.1 response regulator [Ectothiorhodospira variabilis]MCG5505274.1 response regulator [Ectothiorhodospira variabilis]MCG5508431.1 response regulator [Ectothiorhodospira variabilis]MCG5525911.1 response regulator [Ectothiorhodospira haloalkaliphila]